MTEPTAGETLERLRRRVAQWGAAERAVRAIVSPYRVCPIGAHSDHQRGPVLGVALDVGTRLAFAPAEGAECRLASENFPGEARFDVGEPGPPGAAGWDAYARAAAWALRERMPARPRGVLACLDGALPGAGLSSSASVLLAYLSALAAVNEIALDDAARVALSRRAENEYVGLASGILDPASIVASRRDHLLAIDTAAERWEAIPAAPAAPDARILVAYAGVPRRLVDTGFNDRVRECHAAAERLAKRAGLPAVSCLGELEDEVFDAHADTLPRGERSRARHFFGERARVRRGIECWRRGDLAGFGALMTRSGRSSVEHYETGSPELARLQAILAETPGVFGARFSGGGFGGCAIAWVEASRAGEARDEAAAAFAAAFPALRDEARFFLAESDDGLRVA